MSTIVDVRRLKVNNYIRKILDIAEIILPQMLGLQKHIKETVLTRLHGGYNNPDL